ncbi:helix-turn-helix domain-containing protein [Robiginitalea sp. IMCC44478]|uniref:helix-turn-helix domain-containing protein n=1 Tax=Robiginitalea sp. IMCC44478 TaxID=3459122 RepID=UPI0040433D19
MRKKIDITVEKTRTGYSAYADHPGVYTTAASLNELYNELLEALNLYYQDQGYEVNADSLRLHLDLQQFFQYYRVLNATFLAERIGMNPTLLSQYVRGKKKPSARQTRKILEGIQAIGRELSEIKFT